MASGPTYRVHFRRRREGRTDYRHRLSLLKGGKTRAVVRKQNRNTVVQFLDYAVAGDVMRGQATARDLGKLGWKGHTGNLPAAYLAGLLAGSRAKAGGVEEAVLDIGEHAPRAGSLVFAALQGVLDAGIEVPHGKGVLPDPKRVAGNHISPEVAAQFAAVKKKVLEGSA